MSSHHHSNGTFFLDLPEEVIQNVLSYLDPNDINLSVQRVCQKFHRLANEPLLWRYHCLLGFDHWDARHCIQEKMISPVELVDWRYMYNYRRMIDRKTTNILNSIIQNQVNRIPKYEAIAEFGYDAKDTLLRHVKGDEEDLEVLARRYYANSILDYLHRIMALEEWQNILNDKKVPIERALGCFDLFVLHDRPTDNAEISRMLDSIAESFQLQYYGIDKMTTRMKALALVEFMRTHGLTGIVSHLAYQNIKCHYIGLYLRDPECPPLHIISIAIFCALSERVSLDARCCGILNHLNVVVFPKPGETLDGKKLKDGQVEGEPMYLDPHRFMREIPLENVRKNLSNLGLHPNRHMEFLSEMSTISLIQRMSKTILATVRHFRAHQGISRTDGLSPIRNLTFPFPDIEKAHYSALWAEFLFAGRSKLHSLDVQQNQLMPILLERYQRLYPMDTGLIEKYILPFFDGHKDFTYSYTHDRILQALCAVRTADQTPRQIRVRHPLARKAIKYKVGQVFRHKRYYYTAVIIGWDVEGGSSFDWAPHDYPDLIIEGNYQSFYHALFEDSSIRYISEENVEIIEPECPDALLNVAGKYFRRWDVESRTFISGIRDEYPDD